MSSDRNQFITLGLISKEGKKLRVGGGAVYVKACRPNFFGALARRSPAAANLAAMADQWAVKNSLKKGVDKRPTIANDCRTPATNGRNLGNRYGMHYPFAPPRNASFFHAGWWRICPTERREPRRQACTPNLRWWKIFRKHSLRQSANIPCSVSEMVSAKGGNPAQIPRCEFLGIACKKC